MDGCKTSAGGQVTAREGEAVWGGETGGGET